MKKISMKALIAIAVVLVLLFTPACKQEEAIGSDVPANTSGKVELSLYTWTDDGAYMQPLVDDYNSQSSVAHVNLTIIPSSEYDDKILTMMAGGAEIDMLNSRSMQYISRFANSDNLLDLTEMIKSEVDVSPYGTSYSNTRIDDKFYALPYRQMSYGLFYNKKVFDNAGLPYPENLTWDEYAELALKLSSGEGSERAYGGYIPEWLGVSFVPQQMGSNYTDDDVSAISKGLELQNKLYNIDNSHMSYIEMKSTGADYLQFFTSGKVAMLPNGDWCLGDIMRILEEDPSLKDNFELGVAFLPQVQAGQQVTCGGVSTFISINADSKHPKESFDFIKYICGADAAIKLAQFGMLPAYVNDEIISTYKETAKDVSGVDNLLIGDKVPEGLFVPEYAELENMYKEEKELYLIGEQTLEETMSNFIERREKIFEN